MSDDDCADRSGAKFSTTLRSLPAGLIDAVVPEESAGLSALFDSILRWGVLQPLIVRPRGDRFELVAGRRRYAAATAAGLKLLPALVINATDDVVRQIATDSNISREPRLSPSNKPAAPSATVGRQELLDSLGAVAAAMAMTDAGTATLRNRVARQLALAELRRATWMAGALAVLGSPVAERSRSGVVRAAALLRQVAASFEPECRLAGIDLSIIVEPEDLEIRSQSQHLELGVSAMMGAVLVMVQGASGEAGVTLSARCEEHRSVISVHQNVLPLSVCHALRSAGRNRRAQDGVISLGLQAAQHVAETHRGRLEIRGDEASCTLDLKLPLGEGAW